MLELKTYRCRFLFILFYFFYFGMEADIKCGFALACVGFRVLCAHCLPDTICFDIIRYLGG